MSEEPCQFPLPLVHRLANVCWLPGDELTELVNYLLGRRLGDERPENLDGYVFALQPPMLARYPWLQQPGPTRVVENNDDGSLRSVTVRLGDHEATRAQVEALIKEHGPELPLAPLSKKELAECKERYAVFVCMKH